jgi:hypothetical protein
MAMRRILTIGVVVAVLVAGGLASMLAFRPSATRAAAAQPRGSQVVLGHCPKDALPLPAEAVARAADQARIQAPALYRGRGPAVVTKSDLAPFADVRGSEVRHQCGMRAFHRSVVVELLFPKALPSASLSQGTVFVSLFATGYQVWEVAH